MMADHIPTADVRIEHRQLTAAATQMTARKIGRQWGQAWQDEAWEHYDLVGELRFAANAIAGAMGQARLYVGRIEDDADVPVEIEHGPAAQVFAWFGSSHGGRQDLVRRMGVQLFVAGDGWVVGVPPETLDDSMPAGTIPPLGRGLADLAWLVLSVQEVAVRNRQVELRLGDRVRVVDEQDAVLIRVWRPHPRRWWEADSPVRSSLPVLRELVGLTKHISASIDSRLAGAGMLVLPQSVSTVGRIGDTPDSDPESDPFLADLMDAMLTPIKDRDAASAVVPMVVKVPDEVASQIGQSNLITFSTPFDEEAKTLRDESIRRLGLGLDLAPEILLGMGSINHWGAWLVEEQNVRTHVEPPLAMVCQAVTDTFLRPALREAGVTDAESYAVWYDPQQLTMRPDRSGQATALYDRGAISQEALRRWSGFDDVDAPDDVDPAVSLVLDAVRESPGLLADPGVDSLLADVRRLIGEGTVPADIPAADMPDDRPMPDRTGPT